MAEGLFKTETKRVAVVTGANKGIGLEICRQLASKGILVVLTARDEKRGKEALDQNFKGPAAAAAGGLSDLVVFHKLDVVDPASVASLADFVKTQFGKLDILVNNAGISGATMNADAIKATGLADSEVNPGEMQKLKEMLIDSCELALQCIQTNYYGAKRMVEACLPLLQLSDSPRIVNISSTMGKLQYVSKEWAKEILSDAENLSEERVDLVVNEFLKDYKADSLQVNGWPTFVPAYVISKAAMNAYTRILAKKYPKLCINCCCPGYVKTDINHNRGYLSVEEGAETPVKLALLSHGDSSGLFFNQNGVSSFE